MSRRKAAMLAPLACLTLVACGDSEASRGTSGAAIGAGTGAVVCAVTIVGILPCAIVGGAIGGAGGVVTAGPDEPPGGATAAAEPGSANLAPSPDAPAPGSPAPGEPAAAPPTPVTSEPLR
jgi:osmotically inducible lipoprotein OsmB